MHITFNAHIVQEIYVECVNKFVFVMYHGQVNLTRSNTHLLHRCLANLAAHQPGCNQLTASADHLLATVTELAPFPNKNLEIAAATLLLNCSVLLTRKTKGKCLNTKKCKVLILQRFKRCSMKVNKIVRIFIFNGKRGYDWLNRHETLFFSPQLDSNIISVVSFKFV